MRKRAEMLIQECRRSSQKSLKSKSKHYYTFDMQRVCAHTAHWGYFMLKII